MSQFQSRLKELKESSGKTQARIAEDIGVTPQAFSYYVNGREPDYDVLIKIAQYFDVSVDYLLGTSDIKQPENIMAFEDFGFNDDTVYFLKQLNKKRKELAILLGLLLSNKKMESVLANIMLYVYPTSFIKKLAADIDSRKEEYELSFDMITPNLLLKSLRDQAISIFGEVIDDVKSDIEGIRHEKLSREQD